jgi:hypothetical protein
LTSRTLAVVSTAPVEKPALSQANEKAIVKQAACAAPSSSSGFVPRRSSSKATREAVRIGLQRIGLGADLALAVATAAFPMDVCLLLAHLVLLASGVASVVPCR